MVRASSDVWRLDGKTIGIILAIMAQCGTFIWYGAKIDSRVQDTSDKVMTLYTWKEKSDEGNAKITAHLAGVDQKLEDQGAVLRRIDDKVDRILTHGK